jgi:hypothetical protein
MQDLINSIKDVEQYNNIGITKLHSQFSVIFG